MNKGKEKIRVALVINDLLLGGAQMIVHGIASRLDREKFDVSVYVLNDHQNARKTVEKVMRNDGIEIRFLQPGHSTSILNAGRLLRRAFKHDTPDIVHAHLPDAVIAAAIACMGTRAKFIVHEHQTHANHSWKIRTAYRLIRTFASLTICYGAHLERELFGNATILGGPPEKVERSSYTVLNAVDTGVLQNVASKIDKISVRQRMGCAEEDVIIISVGRLIGWKGHGNLVDAFGMIAEEFPRVHLVIVGEGPEQATIEAKCQELSLQSAKKIHLVGAQDAVPELLAASDIFSLVFTYEPGLESEAIGIAGAEAMATGLPVVIGEYESAKEIITHGKNGYLISPRNPQALAGALRELLTDEEKRILMGKEAQKLASARFSWDATMPIYERIYTLLART